LTAYLKKTYRPFVDGSGQQELADDRAGGSGFRRQQVPIRVGSREINELEQLATG
jgi:hypothetical protein